MPYSHQYRRFRNFVILFPVLQLLWCYISWTLVSKFLSAPALKRLLTFCVARFHSFFLFCELFKFPGHVCRTGQLVTLGFSTGNVFTKLGVSTPCSNPQPRGPGALILGLPFLSSDDPALRCQIFALTTPHPPFPLLGLGFADNVHRPSLSTRAFRSI